MSEKAISSRAAEVPRSTLSDLLAPDRRSLPRQALLADVLAACDLSLQEIAEWEKRRRLAARNSRSETVDSEVEIERLQSALAAAVRQVDEFKADEAQLRDRLRAVEREKQELVQELAAARAGSEISTAELSAHLAATEKEVARLTVLAEGAARQALQAEVDAAHLRAALTMLELELAHERGRSRSRRLPEAVRTPPLRPDVAAPAEDTVVGALKAGLHRQIARNDHAATLVSGAADVVQEIEAELLKLLDGASPEVLANLHSLMGRSLDGLMDALRGTAEFGDRARQFLIVNDQLALVSDEVRRRSRRRSGTTWRGSEVGYSDA